MLNRRTLLTAVSACAVTGLARGRAGAGAQEMEITWETGAPIPLARSELGSAVIDGAIYVAGGFGGGARVDRYLLDRAVWERVPDMPAAVHHPGVTAWNGRLIVAGGYDESFHAATGEVWSYDPASGEWSALPYLPVARGAHGLAVIDGALYAAGGAFERLGGPVSGDCWRLETETGTWESLAPLPTPREHLAVVADDGLLYAIGGRADGDEGDAFAAANEVFDPVSGAWETLAPLPVPRGGLAGVNVDGAIIVLGGERGRDLFADVNRFDPVGGAWDALPPMPTGRHGLAAAYANGVLHAITGSVLAGRVKNTPVMELLPLGVPSA